MKNLYTITEEIINKEFGSIENFCATIKQYGECRIYLDDEREKIKMSNATNKITVVATLDVIIVTVDAFLMIHPQATLKDFITFLAKTRANYIKGE